MKDPISSETLFEEFVDKFEWNQESVAVQNPYSLAQIVSMAYTNIEKCGLYQDNCREWSRKPRLDKTRSNFKVHFARAFKETQRSSRTSNTEDYAAKVQAAQVNAALFTNMQKDHTLVLSNLAKGYNPREHRLRCLRRQSQSYRAKLLSSPQNSRQRNLRTPGWKNRDIIQPQPSTAIGRPEI